MLRRHSTMAGHALRIAVGLGSMRLSSSSNDSSSSSGGSGGGVAGRRDFNMDLEPNVFSVSQVALREMDSLPDKARPSNAFGRDKQEIPPGANPGTDLNEKGYIAYKGKVPGGQGKDNVDGVYEKPREAAYFARGEGGADEFRELATASKHRSIGDNIKFPEHHTAYGLFEGAAPAVLTGGREAMKYHGMKPNEPKETVRDEDVYNAMFQQPLKEHHPYLDYTNRSGHMKGHLQGLSTFLVDMELRKAKMSLYRCCLKCLPLLKQFYWINLTTEQMRERLKDRFLINRYVRDEDAIRHLIYMGWMEYTDIISLKRPRSAIHKYFSSMESEYDLQKVYAEQEGRAIEDRRLWNGGEQRKEGSWDGYWSWLGRESAKEHERLAGRVPTSWKVGKGFFEKWKPDGTNTWEKNMDYEGWFVNNVDPDLHAARKEWQAFTEQQYTVPKHYMSKNRRAYRRMVFDIESILNDTPEESYAKSREIYFQAMIRDKLPETNRIEAERRVARHDDEFYGLKHHETERIWKQCIREFPNPRMWRTDTFFMRFRHLMRDLELNWSKASIGRAQEKVFNEWVSDTANYAILNSRQFDEIKADKERNPMARTWAEFYLSFDPDRPETRRLPWYHPEFNYDRRWNWDELCMRRKKWAASGEIDARRPFFDSLIHEAQLNIHRDDRPRDEKAVYHKYVSPRIVQLYRSFNRRLDVAMTNQMRAVLAKASGKSEAALSSLSQAELQALLDKTDFSTFRFDVPTFIYPDGVEQPAHNLDGTPATAAAAAA